MHVMRFRYLFVYLAFALLALAGLGYYATQIEPAGIQVRRYTVAVEASALKGLRVAVISDLHAGAPHIDLAKIDKIVAMTNAERPDLILLTGDYSVGRMVGAQRIRIRDIAAHLKPLRARLGVYAVIGNHDRWRDPGRVFRSFPANGIPVLENRSVDVGRFWVTGIGDEHTHAADPVRALKRVPKGATALCFTHSPDTFAALSPVCGLTVAGHTHGGQVWLPLLGRPAVVIASDFGQRYAIGVVQENGRTLFVSPGIGTSNLPIRLGVPPEISLLEIR
jgi:predicted MPP superfamily phosphohydrolase